MPDIAATEAGLLLAAAPAALLGMVDSIGFLCLGQVFAITGHSGDSENVG
jgi:hypothetical protein